MVGILSGIIALLIGICFLFIPLQFRLFSVLILSVPQLYVLPVGVDISIAFLLPFLLVPDFLIISKRFVAKPLTLITFLLIIVSSISLLWSTRIVIGLRDISYLLEFILIICGVYRLSLLDENALFKVINIMLLFITFEALTIIIFRIIPELKLSIIFSSFMKYFLGNNVVQSLFDGMRNNFLDPQKSGGALFINANTAACYMGISSFLAWFLYKVNKSRTSLILGIILWVSMFFTGSKIAILFSITIPLFVWSLSLKATNKLFLIVINVCMFCFGMSVNLTNNTFISASAEAAGSRYEIWSYAWSAFLKNPLFGQGFGGWEADFGKYSSLPPHNTIIYLWSKSGLLAMILGVFFIFHVIKIARKSRRQTDAKAYYAGASLLMVSIWLFMHGFIENFGLIGDQHQMIILAVLLGYNFAYMDQIKKNRDFLYEDNCNIQKSAI